MLKARINTAKVVGYFDTASVVGSASLLTAIVIDENGVTQHTLTFTQTAAVPDLYLSSEFSPLTAEHFRVVYKYNGTAVKTEYLDAGSHPVPDFPLAIAQDLLVDQGVIPDGEVVTVKVMGSDGVVDDTLAAAFDAAVAGYSAEHTFTTADNYFVIWYKEVASVPTPVAVYAYYVGEPTDKQTVQLSVGSITNNISVAHTGTTVIFTDVNGLQSAKVVTDDQGNAVARVDPGVHIASLLKAGYVFTTNNFSLTVVDTDTETGNNTFDLVSSVVIPTVSDPPAPASMCTLTLQLYRMDGVPFRGAEISVTLLQRPSLFSGAGVVDTRKAYHLDANGYLEFTIVQGVAIEVAIAPLFLRRSFTVPSAAGPYNILTLMSGAEDPFDIITPVIPAAPSRTF